MKAELFNDNFQNFKRYNLPKAQLVIADIPYNIGVNAYGSSTEWYVDGDRTKGESEKAGKSFFNTDYNFNIAEFFHFSHKMLIKEPKETGKAPAMIVFCAFQQADMVISYGKKHGFMNSFPMFFIKNYSSQVLKANMRIVGATEMAIVLYRGKLPKFNNNGKMIFNWQQWQKDPAGSYPKIHPTQKPVNLLKKLIGIFTDRGDVVIDPCAGSGTTLRAAFEMGRPSYGFEVSKDIHTKAVKEMLDFSTYQMSLENIVDMQEAEKKKQSWAAMI